MDIISNKATRSGGHHCCKEQKENGVVELIR
uniref:Uncharacterized protein n=1 Tax=Setaria italica TaxID=4555 RepID=K4A4C2_SETIT